jgi:acylpyruvate hydrolase
MKIICIGRNYADHARELGNDLPTEPVFFLKPDSALLASKMPFFVPEFTNDVHYELELVVRINRLGKHIAEEFAPRYYSEVALGIDFTARDVQNDLKKKGLPWEKAKAFDGSAAMMGEFVSLESLGKPTNDLRFELKKNGETVQMGHTADLIFTIDKIIAYVSQFMTLKIGDLIFTGTPAGVGPVSPGDKLEAFLEGTKTGELNIR